MLWYIFSYVHYFIKKLLIVRDLVIKYLPVTYDYIMEMKALLETKISLDVLLLLKLFRTTVSYQT